MSNEEFKTTFELQTEQMHQAMDLITTQAKRIAELGAQYEELRQNCVEALRIADLTNDAQKMVKALYGTSLKEQRKEGDL